MIPNVSSRLALPRGMLWKSDFESSRVKQAAQPTSPITTTATTQTTGTAQAHVQNDGDTKDDDEQDDDDMLLILSQLIDS